MADSVDELDLMLNARAQSRYDQYHENHDHILSFTFQLTMLTHPFFPDGPSAFDEAQRSDSLKEFATLTSYPHSSDSSNEYVVLSSDAFVCSPFHSLQAC